MLRRLIFEFIFPLILFLFLRSLLRSLFQNRSDSRRPPPPEVPTTIAGGELKRDPVCGTYVSTSLGVTKTVNGEAIYFCSKECRDKFRPA